MRILAKSGTSLVLLTGGGNPAPPYNYIAKMAPFYKTTGSVFVFRFYHL
jgi:hypothetical protein